MLIEEILIVKSNNTLYAIETKYINQISHVPESTKLLLMPEVVLGLSSISGKIVTVLDFNILTNSLAVDRTSSACRIITMDAEYDTTAIVVDSVVNTIEIDESNITFEENVVNGVVATYQYKDSLIQIVSPEKLFASVKLNGIEKRKVIDGTIDSDIAVSTTKEETNRYLLFLMEKEHYAICIDDLREIIAIRDEYTELAGASKEVRGLISLRDELVVIVDLRKYYNFKAIDSESNNILIANIDDKNIGLIVDEILDIRDYQISEIDIMPKNFSDIKVSGIIHLDDKLISVVGSSVIKEIFLKNNHFLDEEVVEEKVTIDENRDPDLEIIEFKLNKERYALDIENIVEIIDLSEITNLADSSDFIKGLINIRGQVIPLISINIILNIEENFDASSKIIICSSENQHFGFMVNEVTDIVYVENSLIHKEKNGNTFFDSVLHLNGGKNLVMLLNIIEVLAYGMSKNG